MMELVQSSFLQALGFSIANSLWQMGLLWLVYFGVVLITKPGAAKKYVLAATSAMVGLGWFAFSFLYYWSHIETPTAITSSIKTAIANAGDLSFYAASVEVGRSLIPYLSCAYLFVTSILAIRLLNGFKEVKKLRTTHLSKPPVEWRLFVKKYAAILSISKPVEIFLSANISSPLTIGFWKPIILLPLAGINHLTPQQVESILLHELSHIRRFDYLLNILLQVAEILLFFNPFMRILLKQAYLERENSCDDWVLQFDYSAKDYAKALLSIEQGAHSHVLALCAAKNQHRFQLLNRIKRMVSTEKTSFNYRSQIGLLALVMVIGFFSQGLMPVAKKSTTKFSSPATVSNITNSQQWIEKTAPVFDLNATLDLLKNATKTFEEKEIALPVVDKYIKKTMAASNQLTPEAINDIQHDAEQEIAIEMKGIENSEWQNATFRYEQPQQTAAPFDAFTFPANASIIEEANVAYTAANAQIAEAYSFISKASLERKRKEWEQGIKTIKVEMEALKNKANKSNEKKAEALILMVLTAQLANILQEAKQDPIEAYVSSKPAGVHSIFRFDNNDEKSEQSPHEFSYQYNATTYVQDAKKTKPAVVTLSTTKQKVSHAALHNAITVSNEENGAITIEVQAEEKDIEAMQKESGAIAGKLENLLRGTTTLDQPLSITSAEKRIAPRSRVRQPKNVVIQL